ncbi:riboflavin synthase [Planktothrix agardhii 1806]|jgi:riboflavin synthase|uniref:riboflavin synthase n=1 Tax=Planktothrix agardhii TaxID=1160 RepID=UPI001A227BC2|nr:riboflavin synthase [Planktothrix agardhii]MBG0746941.1 riboflavin synthase [Planktothrix agardhii KL2]MCF3572361.1 riboflavin synthase [Planktothrix agardhii 1805]MCF3584552.1 riboflavin synthase [Planktothrix agardhii 1803]MCF3587685.1 riboflavin synthase [Planktothrix agardhii 1803]MCF3601235.1 riboflavin synthase [Planktothrix agardhii 1804]
MFTGLIQALATLQPIGQDQFQISCVLGDVELILKDLAIGDSVAVDGVCLTVAEIRDKGFIATASPETLNRTKLGQSLEGYFNLETSLRAGSKLGGHFVTGHIDGVGCLQSVTSTVTSWEMRFGAPVSDANIWRRQIAPYIVPKGSIAVNGISLTISDCDLDGNWFQVAVIPHSYQETNLRYLQPGSWVNIEADILGKYVGKFLQSYLKGNLNYVESYDNIPAISTLTEITPEFLAEHGFS